MRTAAILEMILFFRPTPIKPITQQTICARNDVKPKPFKPCPFTCCARKSSCVSFSPSAFRHGSASFEQTDGLRKL